MNSERPTLSFDGCGINGPDEYRSRLATFVNHDAAKQWGPLFAAAPELLEALRGLVRYAEAARLSVGMGETQLKRLEAAKSAIAKAVPNE